MGPRSPANAELVAEAVAPCETVGRPVAAIAETRGILGLPDTVPPARELEAVA